MKPTSITKVILKLHIILIVFFVSAVTYANSNFNPHDLIKINEQSSAQCLECHKDLPEKDAPLNGKYVAPEMDKYLKSANSMCTDCHGDENSSHIVGSVPEYAVPADLPLTNNKITCLTCHYLHGSLSSDKPMASTSFMDHILNRGRLNKSYILRRNNSDGDLCLACHSKT